MVRNEPPRHGPFIILKTLSIDVEASAQKLTQSFQLTSGGTFYGQIRQRLIFFFLNIIASGVREGDIHPTEYRGQVCAICGTCV